MEGREEKKGHGEIRIRCGERQERVLVGQENKWESAAGGSRGASVSKTWDWGGSHESFPVILAEIHSNRYMKP